MSEATIFTPEKQQRTRKLFGKVADVFLGSRAFNKTKEAAKENLAKIRPEYANFRDEVRDVGAQIEMMHQGYVKLEEIKKEIDDFEFQYETLKEVFKGREDSSEFIDKKQRLERQIKIRRAQYNKIEKNRIRIDHLVDLLMRKASQENTDDKKDDKKEGFFQKILKLRYNGFSKKYKRTVLTIMLSGRDESGELEFDPLAFGAELTRWGLVIPAQEVFAVWKQTGEKIREMQKLFWKKEVNRPVVKVIKDLLGIRVVDVFQDKITSNVLNSEGGTYTSCVQFSSFYRDETRKTGFNHQNFALAYLSKKLHAMRIDRLATRDEDGTLDPVYRQNNIGDTCVPLEDRNQIDENNEKSKRDPYYYIIVNIGGMSKKIRLDQSEVDADTDIFITNLKGRVFTEERTEENGWKRFSLDDYQEEYEIGLSGNEMNTDSTVLEARKDINNLSAADIKIVFSKGGKTKSRQRVNDPQAIHNNPHMVNFGCRIPVVLGFSIDDDDMIDEFSEKIWHPFSDGATTKREQERTANMVFEDASDLPVNIREKMKERNGKAFVVPTKLTPTEDLGKGNYTLYTGGEDERIVIEDELRPEFIQFQEHLSSLEDKGLLHKNQCLYLEKVFEQHIFEHPEYQKSKCIGSLQKLLEMERSALPPTKRSEKRMEYFERGKKTRDLLVEFFDTLPLPEEVILETNVPNLKKIREVLGSRENPGLFEYYQRRFLTPVQIFAQRVDIFVKENVFQDNELLIDVVDLSSFKEELSFLKDSPEISSFDFEDLDASIEQVLSDSEIIARMQAGEIKRNINEIIEKCNSVSYSVIGDSDSNPYSLLLVDVENLKTNFSLLEQMIPDNRKAKAIKKAVVQLVSDIKNVENAYKNNLSYIENAGGNQKIFKRIAKRLSFIVEKPNTSLDKDDVSEVYTDLSTKEVKSLWKSNGWLTSLTNDLEATLKENNKINKITEVSNKVKGLQQHLQEQKIQHFRIDEDGNGKDETKSKSNYKVTIHAVLSFAAILTANELGMKLNHAHFLDEKDGCLAPAVMFMLRSIIDELLKYESGKVPTQRDVEEFLALFAFFDIDRQDVKRDNGIARTMALMPYFKGLRKLFTKIGLKYNQEVTSAFQATLLLSMVLNQQRDENIAELATDQIAFTTARAEPYEEYADENGNVFGAIGISEVIEGDELYVSWRIPIKQEKLKGIGQDQFGKSYNENIERILQFLLKGTDLLGDNDNLKEMNYEVDLDTVASTNLADEFFMFVDGMPVLVEDPNHKYVALQDDLI